ncbi:hypothetical protein M8312_03545 [Sphingomonas sp. KRR8]|uniref:histidine kinase dimerization/phospho-acceptor domain-containing protein n=1 Tax=Sphingomonas sp. KRR8 TaxID=2942996 RepID=UPI0020200A62|nr:histidine kinase dimerization/phospho-acceptor domain-containing protein [Sphingomonas sp. KRR8]URD61596.1 hypothetical protein M8312_03545 [Sphingomonas sp. KRR8]
MTVLALSAEAPRDRVVQWRQLVELVARGAGENDASLLKRALARLAEIGLEVPEAVRAAAARAIAAPRLPLPLLSLFAADHADIAAPLLEVIELADADWDTLRAAAASDTRKLIDTLHPPSPAPASVVQQTETPFAPVASRSAPDLPRLFHWECGPEGEIDWVEGAARAAVIGRSVRADLRQRFDSMQPFLDEQLPLASEGNYAGEWRWSGQPQFTPGTGRFAGYAGVARRVAPQVRPRHDPVPSLAANLPVDHDNLRELIHELRTPLTAIIGFGEVIEGQYLGPAHRAYRDRAGEIVRQARLLLAAVEDLDLAAKLRSGSATQGEGASLAALALTLANRVRVKLRDEDVRCALESGLAERLLRRFVGAMADAAAEGERLQLVIDRVNDTALLAIERPEATFGLSEEQLLSDGAVGNLGFGLRLVRGLAQIVGGSLDVEPEFVVLLLPAV